MKKYVVYFENKGFYADNQKRQYHWVFTPNLDKAKKYKTIKGASDLCRRAISLHEQILLQRKRGDSDAGFYKKHPRGNQDWNNPKNWTIENCDYFPFILYEVSTNGLISVPLPDNKSKRIKDNVDVKSLLENWQA